MKPKEVKRAQHHPSALGQSCATNPIGFRQTANSNVRTNPPIERATAHSIHQTMTPCKLNEAQNLKEKLKSTINQQTKSKKRTAAQRSTQNAKYNRQILAATKIMHSNSANMQQ
jgi:hypothetical protein